MEVVIPDGATVTSIAFDINRWTMLEAMAWALDRGVVVQRVHRNGNHIVIFPAIDQYHVGGIAQYTSHPILGVSVSWSFDRLVGELGRQLEELEV